MSMMTAATGKGRPRSERARRAILDAACELALERGVAASSVEAIARRAGVSKMTVYKWWPNRGHVLLESFFERTKATLERDDEASAMDGLIGQVGNLVALANERVFGALLRDLIATAQADEQIREALNSEWLRPRRAVAGAIIVAGIERGEIRGGIDVPLTIDLLFAPVYNRLLLGHEPLDASLAPAVVAEVFRGIAA